MTAPCENHTHTKMSIFGNKASVLEILALFKSTISNLGFALGFHSKIILQNTRNKKLKHRHIINEYTLLHVVNAGTYSQLPTYTCPFPDTLML